MRRTAMRTPLRRLLITTITIIVILSASPVFAQDKSKKAKDTQQPFEVRLNVSVLDAAGQAVADLRAEDFRLTEDGAAQPVTKLTRHEATPLVGLVIDNSGSLRHEIDLITDFARLLVEGSDPRSEIFVERFVGVDRISIMQSFTTNRRALVRVLEEMYVEGGQSAITDALHLGAEHMATRKDDAQTRRRALVLITDGEDRASRNKPEQLVARLREAGVQVFVVGLTKAAGLQSSPAKAIAYLDRLALETGGAHYQIGPNSVPEAIAKDLLAELNAPYTIAYTPANQKRDGSTRKLSLTVADAPDGAPRRVVFRNTYTAAKK